MTVIRIHAAKKSCAQHKGSETQRPATKRSPDLRVLLFLLATLAVGGSVAVAAAATQTDTIRAIPYYTHPQTGIIEDSGQNEVLGQSMTESVVSSEARFEVDPASRESFVTLTFSLTDNFNDLSLSLQTDSEGQYQPLDYSITKEDAQNHTEDVRFKVPGKDALIRVELYSIPMGRQVIFYVGFADSDTEATKSNQSGTPQPSGSTSATGETDEGLRVYTNSQKKAQAQGLSAQARSRLLLFLGGAVVLVALLACGAWLTHRKNKRR